MDFCFLPISTEYDCFNNFPSSVYAPTVQIRLVWSTFSNWKCKSQNVNSCDLHLIFLSQTNGKLWKPSDSVEFTKKKERTCLRVSITRNIQNYNYTKVHDFFKDTICRHHSYKRFLFFSLFRRRRIDQQEFLYKSFHIHIYSHQNDKFLEAQTNTKGVTEKIN